MTRVAVALLSVMALLVGCAPRAIEGQALFSPPPPPTFPLSSADTRCSAGPAVPEHCSDWIRPPGPVPSWLTLMSWVQAGGEEYADDYICALIPDSMVQRDFGASGFRYLIDEPSCQIATNDNTTVVAHIDIGTGGGLDYWSQYCDGKGVLLLACTLTPTTYDGRTAERVQFDLSSGAGSRQMFFEIPQDPDDVLDIEIDINMTTQNAEPLPGLTFDNAQAYADRVFQDLASILIPASR